MRGAAALMVFAAHSRAMFFGSTKAALGIAQSGPAKAGGFALPDYLIPSGGHQAVLVFFVLSGLLVGGSAIRKIFDGTFRWIDYLGARLSRLWVPLIPILVLGGLLDLAAAHYFPGTPAADSAGRVSIPIFLGNIAFLQDIAVPYLGSNGPLWSLSFEWWFYLAFPLLLIAGMRLRSSPAQAVLAGLLALAIYFLVGPIFAFYFILWCFGAMVAVLPRRIPANVIPKLIPVAVAVLLAVNLLVWKFQPYPLVADPLLAVCAAALCYLLLHAEGPARGRIYPVLAIFLARTSYTLYLAHCPMVSFLNCWLDPTEQPWPITPANIVIVLGWQALVFALCYLLYRAFEANTDKVRGRMALPRLKI